MFCLPVSSMLSCALPRPAGGDAGPLVKYPWPLAPSLKKNHPISALTGVFGVTTNVHPNATTTSATKMPRKLHLLTICASCSQGHSSVPSRRESYHASTLKEGAKFLRGANSEILDDQGHISRVGICPSGRSRMTEGSIHVRDRKRQHFARHGHRDSVTRDQD